MPITQDLIATGDAKDMTLGELRAFVERCVRAEVPLDSYPIVKTSIGSKPRIREIRAKGGVAI